MPDAWGIDDGYHDVAGSWHETPGATRRALRVAMGGLADLADPPPQNRPVWFVRHGSAPAIERPARLVLEDGTELDAMHALPPDLPLGYHDLHPDDGGPTTRVIVSPDRCQRPADRRTWGWSAQLYAARSRESWGIGDLADLRRLVRWSAELGASTLAINPLHAALPLDRQEPSPYFPSSRRYRNPLYLRIEEVAGFDPDDDVLAAASRAGRALNIDRRIDRDEVYRLKMAALAHLWERRSPREDAALSSFMTSEGRDLTTYGVFCALAEHHASGWRAWPGEHRRPENPGVERFARDNADRVRFHRWVQCLVDDQLARAAEDGVATGLGLLGDLAVGVDPDGADAWRWQDVLAPGVRIGAPPDAFNPAGQDWGLPPFVPWKLRAVGYQPFARMLRAAMRHVTTLRVDHVMGLFRLFWLPDGATPAEGAYVRYRDSELLDIVALESARSGVAIVGEDLGTVEEQVRDALHERGVLSYRVAWFEAEPPEAWLDHTLAALTTHDLPTLAAVWSGVDGDDAMRSRLRSLAGDATDEEAAAVNAHQRLGAAPSSIALATLEDALGVTERPNTPGTTTTRANWKLALPLAIEEMEKSARVRAVAEAVGAGRRRAN